MIDTLPFSQACENNKLPILKVLERHITKAGSLLEIASGTGQHAVFFAEQFPKLNWQSTDIPSSIDSLNLRILAAELVNLPPALALDVNHRPWSVEAFDSIFSANSLHIMSSGSVENFFTEVGKHCVEEGKLMIYGPFKYGGEFTTPSNANFDLWLKERDPVSGIRDFEWVNELANDAGFDFIEDNAMPANNQLLVWKRLA